MAFSHGSNARVYVNGYNLSPYLRSATGSAAVDTAETSAFGTSAKTYVVGMRDATVAFEGMFDGSASAIDDILSAALGAATFPIVVHMVNGDAEGRVGSGFEAIETTYEVTTATDDVALVSGEAQSRTGYERIISLHPLTQRSAGGNGTGQDNGALTSVGAVGYLQVTQSTGGTLTAKVQHSVDNSVWVDLITFTNATAIGSQRVATGTGVTVNRYLRSIWTLSAGTATFFIGAHRRITA